MYKQETNTINSFRGKTSVGIMRDILQAKFSSPELADMLKSTGEVYLEEQNTWHDNKWGNCICKKCSGITGKNLLGEILMEIRSNLLIS